MSDSAPRAAAVWADAVLAVRLLAADPAGIGGILLRAPYGPVRDRWLALCRRSLRGEVPLRRLPPQIGEDRLLGGLDLAATLRAGRPVAEQGLLAAAHGGLLLVPMAERLSPTLAGHLAAALDRGAVVAERDGLTLEHPCRIGVVALDEGVSTEERPPASLCDRLAIHLDLASVTLREASLPDDEPEVERVREVVAVRSDETVVAALCEAALMLGIPSLRVPLLALRVARAAAALAGRDRIDERDAGVAARLVLAPRALAAPARPETDAPPEPPAPTDAPEDRTASSDDSLTEIVLQAALATMPPDMLARLRDGGRRRAGAAGRSGAALRHKLRGRPVGVRSGSPRAGARLSLIDTLRAAAPWQSLRRAQISATDGRIAVRPDDFRIRRLKQRAQTTTILAVDASGSQALHRLAEAKGAVELLLAECYVRRDRVALVAFRGRGAELLLPPTRSLVRARRSLAALPGGGGTPLAAGIDAVRVLAEGLRRRGESVVVVVLTDGRANVARDGTGGRVQAEADARSAATALREIGLTSLLIDTSPRPQPVAADLARVMGAAYLPLPHADATALSRAVVATAGPARAA